MKREDEQRKIEEKEEINRIERSKRHAEIICIELIVRNGIRC